MNYQKNGQPKIAIIGAGLGGLACAVALHKKGFNVHVYEKAKDFCPVGGGLALQPNGLKCLNLIDPELVTDIKNTGCQLRQSVLKNIQGETISTHPSNIFEDKYGFPVINIWWWRLQQIFISKLPIDNIHLNHRCTGFSQNEKGVDVCFENQGVIQVDLLIGADGINSAVRAGLIGDKSRYLKSMSWRAVIKYDYEIINPGELGLVKGHEEFMYLLNVGGGDFAWLYRQKMINPYRSSTKNEAKSCVLNKIAEWGQTLRSLVEATPPERILEGGICDLEPLSSWSQGRVTLLGDAAHAMAPALGQGANSSFEDAWVLADSLLNESNVIKALASYEERRIPRTKMIQVRSAEGEMQYYETKNGKSPMQKKENSDKKMTREEFADWLHTYQL